MNFGIQVNKQQPCQCKKNSDGELGRQTVIDGLLKYNSGLTRYLSKYYPKQSDTQDKNNHQQNQPYTEKSNDGQQKENDKRRYVSIVEENNLNFQIPGSNLPKKVVEDQSESRKKQLIEIGQQTSPRQNDKNNGVKNKNRGQDGDSKRNENNMTDNEKKIDEYYKDLKKSSRYLSDTGFRKHFNRQCFENYGRQNTNGVADGILYGNYLKTFNINPHSGANLPHSKQTYEHSLIAAETNKLADYDYIRSKSPQGKQAQSKYYRNGETMQNRDEKYDMEGLIEQSKKHHIQQEKYNHLKLVTKQKQDQQRETAPIKYSQSNTQQTNTQQNIGQRYTQQQNISKRNIKQEEIPRIKIDNQKKKNEVRKEDFRANKQDNYQHNQKYQQPQYQKKSGIDSYHDANTFQQSKIKRQLQTQALKQRRQSEIYNPPKILKCDLSDRHFSYSGCPQYECFQSPQFYEQFKKYVISQGFHNSMVGESINKQRNHNQCEICRERRYTKCCCS